MGCSRCDAAVVSFSVPAAYREYAPEEAAAASICTRCLTVEPASDPPAEPAFATVSDSVPTRPEQAVPLALALGKCDSIALHRTAIEELFRAVERAGTDPLLVVEGLVADPDVEPAVDLDRRRHQLEQLLYGS